MFDLLTNILIWIIAIPIFIILFKAIPRDWFRLFGLLIFAALVAIIFANFRFVEEPIPKIVIDFLSFPFTLVGILLLLLFFNYWLIPFHFLKSFPNACASRIACSKLAVLSMSPFSTPSIPKKDCPWRTSSSISPLYFLMDEANRP